MDKMIILELIQWISIGFIGITLYHCHKTLKALLKSQNALSKSYEQEIRKIYMALNAQSDKHENLKRKIEN